MKKRKNQGLASAGVLCLSVMLTACGNGSDKSSGVLPVTPDTPVAPGTPATPGTPAIPGSGSTPGTGGTPVTPVTPVTPGTPVAPGTPVTPVTPGTPMVPVTPTIPLAPLSIARIQFAQTHVLPAAGLNWTIANDSQSLHLVGAREALALIAFTQADVQQPVLEAWQAGVRVGSMALTAPASLPPVEASATPYANDRWSATIPGTWLKPGVAFKITAANYAVSAEHKALVGLDTDLKLSILPFYLFGANDSNTQPFSLTKAPSVKQQAELAAKWPVAKIDIETIGRVDWARLVIPPRKDSSGTAQPAYVITSMDQQKDGYAVMGATLDLLGKFREANGEGATNNQYYIPLLAIDSGSGKYHAPGGGLGSVGGGTAVADYSFAGATIHEYGHGFGLNHAGAAFDNGEYPYPAGSLKGSVWGYDSTKKQFLSVLLPNSAGSFANCATARQLDTSGHCYKQDPMQGGSGDQSSGYAYTMFADYSVGKIQRWFEGTTTVDTGGKHVFNGGRIFVDAQSATGYSRWDSIAQARVPVTPATTNKGLYGSINMGLPVQKNVAVHAIAITMSRAGTAGATTIYPPVSRTGNLVQLMDPTNAADLSAIIPNTGTYPWYCHASGCDYTVRVTYTDGSVLHRVLEGGFRNWFQPTVAPGATSSDALSGTSFRAWVVNVPGTKAIRSIELLDTPMVWNGLPTNPSVLASR